jgi:hypothetical protein
MATLAELRAMLGQAKVGQNATVMVSGLTSVAVLVSDLYKALPAPAAQTMYVNTPGSTLNIRNAANGTSVVGSLAHGTAVSLSETAFAGTRVWAHITQGWVAYDYLTSTPPVSGSKGTLWGLHVLQGGASGSVLPMAQELKAHGKPLSVVTVVNNIELANALVPFVQYVVFRYVPDNGNSANPNYPPVITEQFGYEWMNLQWVHYVGLNSAVYVQPCNEAIWAKNDCQFWIGVMKYLEDKGRKGAIYADAVGNPTDDEGTSRFEKWADRIPSHRYARAHNHIVVMHLYSGASTPPGELSNETLRPYFEGRPAALYASVPADCRPVLLITEAARELSRGLYDGEDNTIRWFEAFLRYMKPLPEFAGACIWTAGNLGGWETSSVDSALPRIKAVAGFL